MMGPATIELVEEASLDVAKGHLTGAEAVELQSRYGSHLAVEWPTVPRPSWRLTPRRVVGFLPFGTGRTAVVRPKVPIARLLELIAWAHGLRSLRWPDGLAQAASIRDLLDLMVLKLSSGFLRREQRGLHREYIERSGELAVLRGRLLLRRTLDLHLKGTARAACAFEELTTDVPMNQAISFTLESLRKAPLGPAARLQARRARRVALDHATPLSTSARELRGWIYDRLVADYRPLHVLCALVLDGLTPSTSEAEEAVVPFRVRMPEVFERAAAELLRACLPPSVSVHEQVVRRLDVSGTHRFVVDIVLRDAATRDALMVIDTKYKPGVQASTSDIAQVVAYAAEIGCRHAVLLYPTVPGPRIHLSAGSIEVRSACLPLEAPDVHGAAMELARTLLACLPATGASRADAPPRAADGAGGAPYAPRRPSRGGAAGPHGPWRAAKSAASDGPDYMSTGGRA